MFCQKMLILKLIRKSQIFSSVVQKGRKYSVQDAIFNPQKFSQSQNMWKKKDNISGEWELVYKAPMENSVALISNFITGTTIILSAGAIYFAVNHEGSDKPVFLLDSDVLLANDYNEFIIYIAAFIAIHISMKVLISRYVLRLYRKQEEYLAVYQGSILKNIVKHSFRTGEVNKLKPTFFVSWRDSRFSLGNKKGILLQDYFKSPRHFNEFLQPKKDT